MKTPAMALERARATMGRIYAVMDAEGVPRELLLAPGCEVKILHHAGIFEDPVVIAWYVPFQPPEVRTWGEIRTGLHRGTPWKMFYWRLPPCGAASGVCTAGEAEILRWKPVRP